MQKEQAIVKTSDGRMTSGEAAKVYVWREGA